MNEEKDNLKPKKGGNINQGAIYAKISSRYEEILNTLFECLQSKQELVRVSAAKTLLNKILPDLKSVEVGGALQSDGTRRSIELFVNLGGGFVPPTITLPSPSTSGLTSSTGAIQNTD